VLSEGITGKAMRGLKVCNPFGWSTHEWTWQYIGLALNGSATNTLSYSDISRP